MITGTPTLRAEELVRFEVNSIGSPATEQVLVRVIDRPQITSSVLPNGQTGSYYYRYLTMTGGDGASYNDTWSLVSGSLPTGLSLNGSGLISGTPTQTGTWTFRVRVTDWGVSAEGDFSITVTT